MVANLVPVPRSVGSEGFSKAYNNYTFYRQMFKEQSNYTELNEEECSVIEAAILYCHNSHMLSAVNKTNDLLNAIKSTDTMRVAFGEFIAGWYGHNRKTRIGQLADAINYSGVNDIVLCLNRMYGSDGLHSGAEYKSLFVEMNAKQDRMRTTNPPDLYIDLLTPVIAYIDADISSICYIEENYALSASSDDSYLHNAARSLLNLRVFNGIESHMLKKL